MGNLLPLKSSYSLILKAKSSLQKRLGLACPVFFLFVFSDSTLIAQNQNKAYNYIPYAEGFLAYPNDLEANGKAGLGVVGMDIDPQLGISNNPALLVSNRKYVFGRVNNTFSSGSGTIRKDMVAFYTGSLAWGIDSVQGLAVEFVYHSYGYILARDSITGIFKKYPELNLAFGARYARRLTDLCRIGIGIKYYHTNYGVGFNYYGKKLISQGVSTDWGIAWSDKSSFKSGKKFAWGIGVLLQNLGPKVGIEDLPVSKSFLPQNLRIGANLILLGEDNPNSTRVMFGYELNKWLIPTPPLRNGTTIVQGRNNNVSSFVGTFQSFIDAPFGFQEELVELNHRFGIEINQNINKNWFWAVRTGYYYAPISKGGVQYFSFGGSLRYKGVSLSTFVKANPTYTKTVVTEPFGIQLSYLLLLK
jgi:hypothetical protein